MNEYHILWLQTIPSIASIYYYSHLVDTHELYCLDEGQQPQTIRSIARSLHNQVTKSEKKLAVYCSTCSEKKYHSIINFLLKSQEDLKIKCLSLPSSLFQWHILNAWSNNLSQDSHWRDLCQAPFDASTFWQLPDMETVTELASPFTIADQEYSKKALIVHVTPELFDFSLKVGFQLKKFVLQTIQGWKKATKDWSLVWILDENEIFGKKVECVDSYRKKLRDGIQFYASDIPIYTFTVNYDCKSSGDLSHQLAWIQHRHHFCVGDSFLLKWAETPLLPSYYFESLHCIYLNSEAKVDALKWRDNFLSMINHKSRNQDPLSYIRSTTLDLPMDLSNYLTPLLFNNPTEDEQETVLRSLTHQVSFNPETVNDWIQNMQQNKPVLKWPVKLYEMAIPELLDADIDTKKVLRLKEHVRATYKTIEQDESESFSIHSKVEQYEIVIKVNQYQDGLFKMINANCTCKQTHCSHVMATLLLFVDMPIIFSTLSDTQTTVDLGSQKRDTATDDSNSGKRQRLSQETDGAAGFIPYGEPTQLVVNLTHLTSLDENQDDDSQSDGLSQEPQLSQQQELSLGNGSSSVNTKEQLLSFPTLSSIGSIRYKESLSNPLAYSPANVNLKDVVSETDAQTTALESSSKREDAANLTWQTLTERTKPN